MITICKIIQPDVNLESNDKIMLFTRLKFHVEKNNSRRKWNQWISNWPLPELPVWFKSNSISVLFFLRFFYQTSFFHFGRFYNLTIVLIKYFAKLRKYFTGKNFCVKNITIHVYGVRITDTLNGRGRWKGLYGGKLANERKSKVWESSWCLKELCDSCVMTHY